MNYKIYPPSNELKSIVKQYVVFNSLENIEKTLFLPNGCSFIIFSRGASLNAKLLGLDEIYSVPKQYSFTFQTNKVKQLFLAADYDYDNEKFPIVIVEILPIGLYKLLNVDMSLIDFPYEEIEEDVIDEFFSELYSHENTEEALKYLDNSLVELNNSQNNSHLPIEDVVNKIYYDFNLDITIDDLLIDFGYSRSTLERQFKKFIGLTPKNFIYNIKFCNTILDYIGQKLTFSELQYIYSDNSHMNAVFKGFLGEAPSEILKKIVEGEFAIYQLLNIHKEQLKKTEVNTKIDIKELLKYSKNNQVLYVEDDILIRDAMKKLLSNYFTKLDIAEDGLAGLEKYENMHNKNTVYDVVITDINMPKMNGIDMCKAILKLVPSQKIMIISAHCEYITTARELGINYILNKPVSYKELSINIQNLLKELRSKN